jgi:WD40 repeat protein
MIRSVRTVCYTAFLPASVGMFFVFGATSCTGLKRSSANPHSDIVYDVSFSPDGRYLVSASWDGSIKLWDVATGAHVRDFIGHTQGVYDVDFSRRKNLLASASRDATVKVWDVASGQPIRTFLGHEGAVKSVSFSQDGNLLASAGNDDTIRLWDVSSGKSVRTLSDDGGGGVYVVAFSPGSDQVAVGNGYGKIKIWSVDSGQLVRTLPGHNKLVKALLYTPDGKLLVSGGWDNTLKFWDVKTGQELDRLTAYPNAVWGRVLSLALSPDGRTLAVGGIWADHQLDKNPAQVKRSHLYAPIVLLDVETKQPIRTFRGHEMDVYGLAFSPDGKLLASASADHTFKVWDVATGGEVPAFGFVARIKVERLY